MTLIRRILRPAARLVLAAYVALMVAPVAQAGMVGVDVTLDGKLDREAVAAALAREDVQAKLMAHGVDPSAAMERVQAMSDADIARLAADFENAPAGGNFVEFLLIFFVVWAIAHATDWGEGLFEGDEKPAQ